MGFVSSLVTTYKALDIQGILLGSRPYKPVFTVIGGSQKVFAKHLRNSSNSYDMNVNGSVTPVDFYISPPTNETWFIGEWKLQILDQKGFDVGNFGALGSQLTNGLDCILEVNGVQTSILDYTIKTNADITEMTFDSKLETFGNTSDSLHARWSFSDSGQNIRLSGSTNDKLIVRVQDDLTALTSFKINVQGYKYEPSQL